MTTFRLLKFIDKKEDSIKIGETFDIPDHSMVVKTDAYGELSVFFLLINGFIEEVKVDCRHSFNFGGKKCLECGTNIEVVASGEIKYNKPRWKVGDGVVAEKSEWEDEYEKIIGIISDISIYPSGNCDFTLSGYKYNEEELRDPTQEELAIYFE